MMKRPEGIRRDTHARFVRILKRIEEQRRQLTTPIRSARSPRDADGASWDNAVRVSER